MYEKDVIKNTTVDSFAELASLVQKFRKDDGKWIFRGVAESTYKLIPKIGRPGARKGRSGGNNLPYDRTAEETMIREFIRSAGPHVKHIPLTQLEWLALAQHHGMATRLLDWSTSLLVAAYFAVKDSRGRKSHPMIYCVRDVPLAPEDKHECLDELDDVMLYYPPHISPRIPAQSGLFTVHRNPDRPFAPDRLVCIEIGKSPLTFKFNLNACGIHQASLFPDIDGLAAYHSWLYKWQEHLPYDE
ncbi:FRG domain-containing protein [Paraburkholderia graminis]|uniref:FRG domain-containing protein n=1 Tax=Paraburkholderia graminis TaxID=60548 RepID=UPI0038BA131D